MQKSVLITLIILAGIMIISAFLPSTVIAQTNGTNKNIEDTSDDNMKSTLETNNINTGNSTMSESGQISKRGN